MLDKLNILFEELKIRNNRRLLLYVDLHPEYSFLTDSEAEKDISEISNNITDDHLKKNFNKMLNRYNNHLDTEQKSNKKKNSKSYLSLKIAAGIAFILFAGYSVYNVAFNLNKIVNPAPEYTDKAKDTSKTTEESNLTDNYIAFNDSLVLPDYKIIMPESFGFVSNKIDTVFIDNEYLLTNLNKNFSYNFFVKNDTILSENIKIEDIEYFYQIIKQKKKTNISIISYHENADSTKLNNKLIQFMKSLKEIEEL